MAHDLALDRDRLESARALEQLEIAKRQTYEEAEIAAHEEVERSRITSDRGLDEARIVRDRELRQLEVEREQIVELAEMEKAVALYQKSKERSAAQAAADAALAKVAEAEEKVVTVRESEITKRLAAIDIMMAEKEAEAKKIAAQAEKVHATVMAEAQRQVNEAENVLTNEARDSLYRRKLLEHVEGIVRESAKPMEKIEGINILHVDGLAGGGEGGKNMTDEVMDSALRYRVQAPLIDNLLKEVGIEGGSVSKMGDIIRSARDMQSISKAVDAEGKAEDPEAGDDGGKGKK